MQINIQLFGVKCPPLYGKDDDFYIKEALKVIGELRKEYADAEKELDILEECVKHFDDESEK